VHLTFDRPVLPLPHAVLVERPTQWVFRKDDAGTRVHAVISAADDLLPVSSAEIIERVVTDLHACFPASAGAEPSVARVVKERRATFSFTPSFRELRPDALVDPAVPIALAGDYVTTGWPATMESAVRGGRLAADALLGADAG